MLSIQRHILFVGILTFTFSPTSPIGPSPAEAAFAAHFVDSLDTNLQIIQFNAATVKPEVLYTLGGVLRLSTLTSGLWQHSDLTLAPQPTLDAFSIDQNGHHHILQSDVFDNLYYDTDTTGAWTERVVAGGEYSSMTVDPVTNKPRITYNQIVAGPPRRQTVRLTLQGANNTWIDDVIDNDFNFSFVGGTSTVALASGKVDVFYPGIPLAPGQSELRVAEVDTILPFFPSGAVLATSDAIGTLVATRNPYDDTPIALSTSSMNGVGYLGLSYRDFINGLWVTDQVDSITDGTAAFGSAGIAIGNNGVVHLAAIIQSADGTRQIIKYYRSTNTVGRYRFAADTILSSNALGGGLIYVCAIAVDPAGNDPVIAFGYPTYAEFNGRYPMYALTTDAVAGVELFRMPIARHLAVAPSPVRVGQVIRIVSSVDAGAVRVVFHDIMGREVAESRLHLQAGVATTMRMPPVAPGIYLLSATAIDGLIGRARVVVLR